MNSPPQPQLLPAGDAIVDGFWVKKTINEFMEGFFGEELKVNHDYYEQEIKNMIGKLGHAITFDARSQKYETFFLPTKEELLRVCSANEKTVMEIMTAVWPFERRKLVPISSWRFINLHVEALLKELIWDGKLERPDNQLHGAAQFRLRRRPYFQPQKSVTVQQEHVEEEPTSMRMRKKARVIVLDESEA